MFGTRLHLIDRKQSGEEKALDVSTTQAHAIKIQLLKDSADVGSQGLDPTENSQRIKSSNHRERFKLSAKWLMHHTWPVSCKRHHMTDLMSGRED